MSTITEEVDVDVPVRVACDHSLVGIELLTIDARIVVASVDTYLRFAEAANRLAIGSEPKGLSDLVSDVKGSGSTKSKTKGVLEGVGETLGELLGGSASEREPAPRRRRK